MLYKIIRKVLGLKTDRVIGYPKRQCSCFSSDSTLNSWLMLRVGQSSLISVPLLSDSLSCHTFRFSIKDCIWNISLLNFRTNRNLTVNVTVLIEFISDSSRSHHRNDRIRNKVGLSPSFNFFTPLFTGPSHHSSLYTNERTQWRQRLRNSLWLCCPKYAPSFKEIFSQKPSFARNPDSN